MQTMKNIVLVLTTGMVTVPAVAVLSGDTGQIHGRAPTVSGKLHAAFPDGTTLVTDDTVVGWSQIPEQFTLVPLTQDLTLEDEDGDSGLHAIIDVAQANLTWYRNGIPLTANQLKTMLGNYVTQNDELMLEVSAPVTVSSVTGLPTTAGPVFYSNQYSLKGPLRYSPAIFAGMQTFALDSGFPSTGFINAQFDILMDGTSVTANSNFIWEVNANWLSINSNGRITFERKPASSESRTVSVKATNKQNGEIWTWPFTIENWFTGYANERLNWGDASNFCNAQGQRLAERAELTNGYNIRGIGSLFAEWGSLNRYSYSGYMPTIFFSWTSTPNGPNEYYQVLLQDGRVTANSTSWQASVVCRQDN